jgi:hypothetical protein
MNIRKLTPKISQKPFREQKIFSDNLLKDELFLLLSNIGFLG